MDNAAALTAILAADHRSAEHKARDVHRHPAALFAFFGLQPDMTIADIWPGSAGWTTEILAPFLRDRGRYIAASYDPGTETSFNPARSQAAFLAKLATRPDLYDKVVVSKVSQVKFDIAPAGSVDLIVFLRLAHVFARNGALLPLLKACHAALKSGGALGLTDHRAKPHQPRDPKATNGYIHEDQVIELAQEAGFALAARSELKANPKDTCDHSKGVWSLPPWLWEGEVNRDKYLAIGESDRMTLKFIKV